MGREARDHRDRRLPKPVTKIELSGNKPKLRLALAVIFGLIGVGLLVYSFLMFINGTEEWQDITVPSSAGMNSSSELVLTYHLGQNGMSAAAEKKKLVLLYTDAAVRTYQVFNTTELFEGVNNLCFLNQHVNEEVEVDALLYQALETLDAAGRREQYLAPVYEQYSSIFYSQNDTEIAEIDPFLNPEAAEWFDKLAAFARDEEAVSVELLGNNRVKLQVSNAYLSYCKEEGIEKYVDFNWMTNAFIVDYIADLCVENGFTNGSLSSYDGFVRCFNESPDAMEYPLYYLEGNVVDKLGTLRYSGPRAIVSLRNFPMNSLDFQHYYELQTGEIRFPYIDVRDGLCRSTMNELIVASETDKCATMLMKIIPFYIADQIDAEGIRKLYEDGITATYCENGEIFSTDSSLSLEVVNPVDQEYFAIPD